MSLFGSFHLRCNTGADVVGSGFRLVFAFRCVSVVAVLFGNKSKDDFLLSRGIGGLRFLFWLVLISRLHWEIWIRFKKKIVTLYRCSGWIDEHCSDVILFFLVA